MTRTLATARSGGREKPKGKPFERPYHLFDLTTDPAERDNVIDAHPKVAQRLAAALQGIRERGRSVPR